MGAFTYPRSEPGSSGHMDLVEHLNGNTPALRAELAGLSDEAVSRRPSEEEWSLKENCAHLCDSAKFLHRRLSMMIQLEDPRLKAWDQEEELRSRDLGAVSIQDLLAEFAAQRGETVDMLAELVHWNWARTGRHEEHGRLSIRQLVDRALAHEEGHLDQIRALKAAAGA